MINCDYCSLVNGVIHTAVENVKRDMSLVQLINVDRVSFAVRYFDVVLMHRLSRPTNVDVHMWCISAFGSSNEKLMLLSKLYLQLETVELRWCPFN